MTMTRVHVQFPRAVPQLSTRLANVKMTHLSTVAIIISSTRLWLQVAATGGVG